MQLLVSLNLKGGKQNQGTEGIKISIPEPEVKELERGERITGTLLLC